MQFIILIKFNNNNININIIFSKNIKIIVNNFLTLLLNQSNYLSYH